MFIPSSFTLQHITSDSLCNIPVGLHSSVSLCTMHLTRKGQPCIHLLSSVPYACRSTAGLPVRQSVCYPTRVDLDEGLLRMAQDQFKATRSERRLTELLPLSSSPCFLAPPLLFLLLHPPPSFIFLLLPLVFFFSFFPSLSCLFFFFFGCCLFVCFLTECFNGI